MKTNKEVLDADKTSLDWKHREINTDNNSFIIVHHNTNMKGKFNPVVFVLHGNGKIIGVYSEAKWKDGTVIKAYKLAQKLDDRIQLESVGLDE